MTDFEKYQASSEARHGTHGEHIDKLTGYFLAETNRMREHAAPTRTEPEAEPAPQQPAKRTPWWRFWRHH